MAAADVPHVLWDSCAQCQRRSAQMGRVRGQVGAFVPVAKDAADASREGPESHRAHLHGVVCVGSLTSESGSSVHIPLLLSPSSLRLGYAKPLLSRDFCLLLVCLLQERSTSTDSDGDGSELLG